MTSIHSSVFLRGNATCFLHAQQHFSSTNKYMHSQHLNKNNTTTYLK